MSIADGELTSLALCWRIERPDGAGVALTSHDQPILVDGAMHCAAPGMVPSAISRRLGLEAHSAEVAGALTADAISATDLALGRWDAARVTLAVADWTGEDDQTIPLFAGELASIHATDGAFTAELRGAAAKLEDPVCPATSAECRARFGDKACRVDLAGRTIIARVVSIDGAEIAVDQPVDDRYVLGRLRYLSGANCGRTTLVMSASGTTLSVRDLPAAAVEPGCRIELREGCDKRLETCRDRFSNTANFRGEPHLPGNDLLTRYPGA
jgi:uncharacterized phage protein (TIGR02218 family)